MKYQAGNRRRAIEYEKALVEWWKQDKTFEKSVENRPAHQSYVFYDGPPFITGNPHHGTLLSSIVKDAVPRFWTMNGYRVERRWGWDCHGLPAENFVEKQLGITDRREIGTKWSLEEYIIKARESMVANSETWRGTIDRIGRWVDFDNCYRTMNKDFMESVWWAFKTLYEKGKIYEGRKVLMYDTKFATPVSKAEVTMDNDAYQVVTDPSAYVKFKVAGEDAYFLAWTTTPWTLPANMALAINPKLEYGYFEVDGSTLILALERAKALFEGVKPVKAVKGEALVGKKYEPIIEVADGLFDLGADGKAGTVRRKDTYTVLPGDFVSAEDGTGIVHIAPAYGEDDYALSQKFDIDFVDCLDENGYYLPEMAEKLHELGVRDTDESGIQVWAGNKFIAKCLEEKGIIYKIEYIQHEYPFNPRSKERIIYRAFPSWFFDVDGSKALMLAENENINWFPEYLKHGRFAKNIEAAPDWNLSRDRFWATAMPVWKGDKGTVKVVGSYDELYELSGKRLEDYHRPWVDEIEFDIDGEHFKRIEKVLDCWFESGSMPFAQLHYPFENKEKFEQNYPADFIVEYVGQVRAWFYYVHCVNTALFGHNAYKNVITTGTLAGNDGRKMSKSLGNYTDPNELMDKYSADSLRFLLLSSPVLSGEDFALLDKDVSDVNRKLSMIWNVYDFFTTYAEAEGWDSENGWRPAGKLISDLKNPLDRWIIARLYEVKAEIIEGMHEYNIPKALEGVLPFVDDLSNWFVRRSRRRFNKNENEEDKKEAFWTLYTVLVRIAMMMAPFTPFLAEELYQKMTGSGESVHLLDYPKTTEIDDLDVLNDMKRCREIITEGLAMRMNKTETEEQIKVRQPLSEMTYAGEKLPEFYEGIIADEVNVKKVTQGDKNYLNKTLTPELEAEGFVRELIRSVQAARKKAGLTVNDHILLSVLCEVPEGFTDLFMAEVLADSVVTEGNYAYDEIVKVNGENVTISLQKA
ncbi:MAG: isoleucine--tRNA ligase [Candidatus Saccharibacteria bacterium]|nr:isoleucine--tRNA ligase [Candidatus Saccharibacteria bacterium]